MDNGILHIMGNHQGRKLVTVDNHLCGLQNFCCSLRIKCSSMLIQKQQLWLLQRCHQKSQRLSLSTREQTYFGSQSVFQSKTKSCQQPLVYFPLASFDTGAKRSCLTTSQCQCQVFFNSHSRCSSVHRILEHTAKISSTLVLRKFGYIFSINDDLSLIHRPYTCNSIQKS